MLKELKRLLSATTLLLVMQPALSSEPVRFALCFDLSKVYVAAAPQLAQAVKDLADLKNMKGGLEGHPIEIIVADHGNEPQRALACYERLKREGVMMFNFFSTPADHAVLPRIMQDGNIHFQTLSGRGDAVDGEVYKWVLALGPTYWGQAANIVSYFKKQAGGNLKGKRIAFTYLDFPLGREPIPILQELQKLEGFELHLLPYQLPGNDQTAAFAQIRRLQPDWVINWSVTPLHAISLREMQRNGIPMEKLVTVNWINELDLSNSGMAAAKGLKRSTPVVGGTTHPLIKEIARELYDKGKGNGDRKYIDIGETYYNTGLAIYSGIFEGVRLAIKNQGWPLTPEKIRQGFYSMKNFDGGGFMAPLTITPKDHGGGGKTRIEMWDGTQWVAQTDWFADYNDQVWSIVKKHSSEFAKSGK